MRYNLDKSKLQFMQVKPMLKCYEKYLGKYPFWNDGYALVETPYLGMEHQGAIAYGNKYLTGYAGTDYSRIGLDFDYIIIHESGHEWWGNSVSCKDIADMWIHEGFCTYTESIYVEYMFGYDTAMKYINAHKAHVGNKKPIVGIYGVNEEGDGDMYSKGSLFLNTLRSVVNDDKKWWSIIKGMSDTAFKFKNIGYEDVVNYFSTKTGKDLSAVFEQYLKFPKIPVFEYSLKKVKKGEFELSYHWVTDVAGFKMPVIVNANERLNSTNELQTTTIKLKKETDFKVSEDLEYIEVRKQL
jgi:aminopeptidase N